MNRRAFLQFGVAAGGAALAQQKPPTETVTATATQLNTPRVGIVLSSFTGSEDHDGTKIAGLAEPKPVSADLAPAQLDAMLRKAIEIGVPMDGLKSVLGPEDWIVVKPRITTCYGLGPDVRDGGAHTAFTAGSVTDLRLVRSLLIYMAEHKCGARITIAEGSPEWLPMERSKSKVDGWSTDWGGAFGGLSYRGIVEEVSKKYPSVKFEIVDLNFDETIDSPVPGNALAKKNPEGMYGVPRTIQQCDRLISVAPLATHPLLGVSLGVGNYWGIAPGSKYGFPKDGLLKLGAADEVVVDLYSFRPADYAIVGGSWGLEGEGSPVQHNVLITGSNCVAVDAIAASIMGFTPAEIAHLALAEQKGFGGLDTDLVWTRGNDVEQATRKFRRPSAWKPAPVKK